MGSWTAAVVMMCVVGSREPMAGAREGDIVDSIMCAAEEADKRGSYRLVLGRRRSFLEHGGRRRRLIKRARAAGLVGELNGED